MTTILVTGASRGLGLEFVRQYAAQGQQIIATCRNPETATQLQQIRTAHPDNITIFPLDVGDAASIEACAAQVHTHTPHLDILINNAGIPFGGSWEQSENLFTLNMDAVMEIIRVNAVGALLVTQHLIDLLKKGANSRIINISSLHGSIGDKPDWMEPCYGYSASKVAMNIFSSMMNKQLAADQIMVVAIDPGWVRTDMGGADAAQAVDDTTRQMIQVIDQLKPEQGGGFWRYDGERVEW